MNNDFSSSFVVYEVRRCTECAMQPSVEESGIITPPRHATIPVPWPPLALSSCHLLQTVVSFLFNAFFSFTFSFFSLFLLVCTAASLWEWCPSSSSVDQSVSSLSLSSPQKKVDKSIASLNPTMVDDEVTVGVNAPEGSRAAAWRYIFLFFYPYLV